MSKGKEAARSGGAVKAAKPVVGATAKKTKQNGIHGAGGKGTASVKPGESSSMAAHHTDTITKDGKHLADDALMQSLQRHDASCSALLSLIPAHLYLAPESDSENDGEEEEEEADTTINGKTKKRKQDKASLAAERKARIREAKRAKLDPENQKSAIEIQQERAAKRAERQAANSGMKATDDALSLSFSMLKDTTMHAGDTDSGEDDDDDDAEDDDGDSYETLPTSAKGSEELNDQMVIPSPPLGTGPPSILDLRARLQAKIQGMQAQRRAPVLGGGVHVDNANGSAMGDDESTASTKDELLEERRKKRGDMREARRKAMKERKRSEREQLGKKGAANAGNDRKGAPSGTTAPALFVSPAGGNAKKAGLSTTAEIDDKNEVAFSALQFDEDERLKKKSKHALPSDPKVALAMLEARKRRDEARKAKRQARSTDNDDDASDASSDDDADRTDNLRWNKVEAAAQGVKIRDDEQLLRKAAKKRDKLKAKSSTEWKKRARDLSSQQAARVKKRSDNIAARKDRKMKGGSKSGGSGKSAKGKALGGKPAGGRKARAGFEGKPRSFGEGGKSGRGGGSGGGGSSRGGHKGGRGGGGGGRGGGRS